MSPENSLYHQESRRFTTISQTQKEFNVQLYTFPDRLELTSSADSIMSRQQIIAEEMLFTVFPAVRATERGRRNLHNNMNSASGLVLINPEDDSDDIIGVLAYNEVNKMNTLHITHIGVLPEYTGSKLTQIALDILIQTRKPDAIFLETLHQGIWASSMHIAQVAGYDCFPQKGITERETYEFAKNTFTLIEGSYSARALDQRLVLRDYYQFTPQGAVPFDERSKFFRDTLYVRPRDAVLVMLLKQGLDRDAYQQNYLVR